MHDGDTGCMAPSHGALLSAILLLPAALTGCLGMGGDDPTGAADPSGGAFPACVHPWPCGDGSEWPAYLKGPFGLREVVEARVPAYGDIELHGYVLLPDVPDDVRVPVVLSATAYYGHVYQTPESPHGIRIGGEIHGERLIEEGYAVAYFNVRGTGQSDGCMEWWGPNEQRDLAMLVDWLGDQSWSNGRVAMTGGSYGGTTPYAAAIHNPTSLKTIVPLATVTDAYLFLHTPQGAPFVGAGHYLNGLTVGMGFAPPVQGEPAGAVEHATRLQDRMCPETRAIMRTFATEQWSDTRNATFWDERRLIDGFPNLTASVFIGHGFLDRRDSGHAQQELSIWNALEVAPKRMFEGQWGHSSPQVDTWEDQLVAWFDYWLKGIGDEPPGLGIVEYEDNKRQMHKSSAWPPAEARQEALYLTGSALAPHPTEADRSFLSAPHPDGGHGLVCEALLRGTLPASLGSEAPTLGRVYFTTAVAEDTLLAGNPFAYLRLMSDTSTGLFSVELFDVGPDATCPQLLDADSTSRILEVSSGSVDLRFHAGNFDAIPFPTATPTDVRVDLDNLAHVLPAGHRLAVVLSYGTLGSGDRSASSPHAPTLTVLTDAGAASSHVVLPVVDGTFDGTAASIDYPPRPFVPKAK